MAKSKQVEVNIKNVIIKKKKRAQNRFNTTRTLPMFNWRARTLKLLRHLETIATRIQTKVEFYSRSRKFFTDHSDYIKSNPKQLKLYDIISRQ